MANSKQRQAALKIAAMRRRALQREVAKPTSDEREQQLAALVDAYNEHGLLLDRDWFRDKQGKR